MAFYFNLFIYISGSAALHVELTAKRTALLVGETITITCLARGSEILEDHWKYPGKVVRTYIFPGCTKDCICCEVVT